MTLHKFHFFIRKDASSISLIRVRCHMLRLSPRGEASVKAKAKCISRPHCALAAPSPTAEATRDAYFLRWREKMQIYTSSLLKRKLPLLDAPLVGGGGGEGSGELRRRRALEDPPARDSLLPPPSSLPSPTPTRGAPPLSPSAAPLAAISLSAPPRRLLRRPALLHSARGTPAAPPRGSRGSGLGRGAASGAGDPRRSAPTPSHPWPAAMARSG